MPFPPITGAAAIIEPITPKKLPLVFVRKSSSFPDNQTFGLYFSRILCTTLGPTVGSCHPTIRRRDRDDGRVRLCPMPYARCVARRDVLDNRIRRVPDAYTLLTQKWFRA